MTANVPALLAPPAPLVPPDVSMGNNDWFPLHFRRMRKSRWWRLASDVARSRSVDLWGYAYEETPAGSLPDDDIDLAEFAGFGRDLDAWGAVKAEVMAAWTLCSDGRWYHPTLCEFVLETWEKGAIRRQKEKDRKADYRARSRGTDPNVPRDDPPLSRGTDPNVRDGVPVEEIRGEDIEEPPTGGSMPDAKIAPASTPPKDEKPTKANPKKGSSRIEADWIADDDLRAYARVNLATAALPHDEADLNRLEDAFRDHWLASSKPEAFKLDWRAAFRTWVRNEIKFAPKGGSHGRANSTGPRRGGIHDTERLRAFLPRGDGRAH